MSILYDSNGKKIHLDKEIGRGGEGTIYSVEGSPQIVAKVYHQPILPTKEEKLRHMATIGTSELHKLAAWPTSVLQNKYKQVCGLLMPLVSGHKELHLLYAPVSRKTEFPDVDWAFLIHVAQNLARAVATIHQHGHVIGDINQGNFVVAHNGTVKLIDCDSIQINGLTSGKPYLCEVGVKDYTPPELHGKPFHQIIRTESHDAFGLAVLIFQLLLLGRHPFSGTPIGKNQVSLGKAIRMSWFAYASGTKFLKQPPNTPQLAVVSPFISNLFIRAFVVNNYTQRPSAHEWIRGLQYLKVNLKRCTSNRSHVYFKETHLCPWCLVEASTNTLLFKGVLKRQTGGKEKFDPDLIWKEIESISPPPTHNIGLPTRITKPSKVARHVGNTQVVIRIFAFLCAIVPSIGSFYLAVNGQNDACGILIVGLVIAFFSSIYFWNLSPSQAKLILQEYDHANKQYEGLKKQWNQHADGSEFRRKKNELNDAYMELKQIGQWKKNELNKLKTRSYQLTNYLEKFKVHNCNISGIGPTRIGNLTSRGIKTAADISYSNVRSVPGFGDHYTMEMDMWRSRLERKFVYNPNIDRDPKVIAETERLAQRRRENFQLVIKSGPNDLRKLKAQAERAQQDLLHPIRDAALKLAQATVDKRRAFLP